MTKSKKAQVNKSAAKPSKFVAWFKKFTQKFYASSKSLEQSYPTLEEATIEDLRVEELTNHLDAMAQDSGDVEIAFINPETGELEVVSLPNDVFKVQVKELQTSPLSTESVVVLEVDSSHPFTGRAEEEEDASTRITHFPPHGRLH